MILQRPLISREAPASYRVIPFPPRDNRNPAMAFSAETTDRLVCLCFIVNGNHGDPRLRLAKIRADHSYRTKDDRNLNILQYNLRIVQNSSEEDDSLQPFLLCNFLRGIGLIRILVNGMQQILIAFFFQTFLEIRKHTLKERVIDTLDKQNNGIGLRHLEIPRTVIGNIVKFLHHLQHPLPCPGIDPGVIVNGP